MRGELSGVWEVHIIELRVCAPRVGTPRRMLGRWLSSAWLMLLVLPLLLGIDASTDAEPEDIESENEKLRQRLKELESQLHEAEAFSYVVAKGYIAGAETIFMETMEVAEAKQWCNANPNCKGFTFLAPLEDGDSQANDKVTETRDVEPDDEVTVTFKAAPEDGSTFKVDADPGMVSYIKETTKFGAVGDAAMQLSGTSGHTVVAHWLGFESGCFIFVLSILCYVGLKHRGRSSRSSSSLPLYSK
jgi:hypothetical protein